MSDDLEALRESLRTSLSTDTPKDKVAVPVASKDPDKVQLLLSEMNSEISKLSVSIDSIKHVLDHISGVKPVDLDTINDTLVSLHTQQEILTQDVKMIIKYLGFKDPIE